MSAKTCQLCGKPLSKIWIGAGEFCSREHRNQYRMRRGMDRLLEANQVASLLRRRETPKAISPDRPPADAEPRLADHTQVRLSASPDAIAVPASGWAPTVTIPDARGPIAWRPRLPVGQSRPYEMLRQMATRVVQGRGAPSIPAPGGDYLNRLRRPQRVGHPAHEGMALRVSMSSGFRLPSLRSQSLRAPAPRSAAFLWPNRMRLDGVARHDIHSTAQPLSARFPFRPLQRPTHRELVLTRILKPGGPLRGTRRAHAGSGMPPVRVWGTLWPQKDNVPIPVAHYRRAVKATPGLTVLPVRVISGSDDPRLALVPLSPQDGRSPYAPVITIAVERPRVTPQETVVESFDSGLANWVGTTEDWSCDAAGVRTGSLALLMSSLDMHDYEMEFLARIENRSVTCVFRAAGDDQYYAATIASNQRGGLEFTRRTVMGGASDAPVIIPLSLTLSKSAFNVRLRALGNSFCLWVNGQKIADWTDSRLVAGGVGFVGTAKDRARIYWVKLSPVGEPGKES